MIKMVSLSLRFNYLSTRHENSCICKQQIFNEMAHNDDVADNEPGWPGVAMVLGKLPVLGCPINFDNGRTGDTALAVGSGGDCIDIFPLDCHFSSSFSHSLGGVGRVVRWSWVAFQCRGVLQFG